MTHELRKDDSDDTQPDEIGVEVRQMSTEELLAEFEQLQERLEWVRDELNFRFNHERDLAGQSQKNDVAKALNEFHDTYE